MTPDVVIPSGKFVRKMNCTPYTDLLDSERAEVPDPVAAVFELVDNPIETALLEPHKFTKSNPLRIKIFVHDYSANVTAPIFKDAPGKTRPVIVVEDNAGGVRMRQFERMFRFGEAGEKAKRGISAYGRGGKRARLKLGNLHGVISRTEQDKEYFCYQQLKTGQDTNWDFDLKWRAPRLDMGTTQVVISDLLVPITPTFVTNLGKRLGETYSDLLKDKKIEILLNGGRIEPEPIDDSIEWSGAPFVEPAKIKFSYEVPVVEGGQPPIRLEKVDGEVTIGLLRETKGGNEYGFDVICNGRLLHRYVKDEMGFCPKPEGWGTPTQKISAVRGIVRLFGSSKAMPWRSNKVEFDDDKVRSLRQAIVRLCGYWVDAAKTITRQTGADAITSVLGQPFQGSMRILHRAPTGQYKAAGRTGSVRTKLVAFHTSEKKVDLAKTVFNLVTKRELSEKARQIFESAVDAEVALSEGATQSADFKGLADAGVPSRLRIKLGLSGEAIEDLIEDIAAKDQNEAISDLRSRVRSLSRSEAIKVYKAAIRIRGRESK